MPADQYPRDRSSFHLRRGLTGPVQQSPVTCGSAALTVARMLTNPDFARWIISGLDPKGGPPDSRTERERFAEHEGAVMNRTNGFRGGPAAVARLRIPWPHALGTPPWGAAAELEDVAASSGAAYAMRLVRLSSTVALRDVHRDLVARVRNGLPALLYVGSAWAPRHVTLVLPGGRQDGGRVSPDGRGDGPTDGGDSAPGAWPDGDHPATGSMTGLDVYDPATGSVTELVPELFASRALAIAGWDFPWITVHPRQP